jgi:hypothetical protein
VSRDGCPMPRSSIIRKASEGYRGHQVGVCLWRDHDWRRVVEAHLVDGFKKQSATAAQRPDKNNKCSNAKIHMVIRYCIANMALRRAKNTRLGTMLLSYKLTSSAETKAFCTFEHALFPSGLTARGSTTLRGPARNVSRIPYMLSSIPSDSKAHNPSRLLAEMNPDMVRSGVDLLWNVLEYVC